VEYTLWYFFIDLKKFLKRRWYTGNSNQELVWKYFLGSRRDQDETKKK
jgi:hypothetical protein